MLISRCTEQPTHKQGGLAEEFAELRRRLAAPSECNDEARQRLLDLKLRLTQIQTLGDEYRRVELSEHVEEILTEQTPSI